MRAQPMRFTGMASGMDTDSIVKDMLRPQQYKIDNEKKAQALIKLKQDAWKDMHNKLYSFHTKYTHKLSMAGSFNNKTTTLSNPKAIDIGNGTQVPEGTHEFIIDKLATSTSVTGTIKTDNLGTDEKGNKIQLNASTTVGQLTGNTADYIELKMTVKVNGKDEEVSVIVGAKDSLDSVAKKMNAGLKGKGFTAGYDAANGKFFVNSTKTGKGQDITFTSGNEVTKIEPAEGSGEEPTYEPTGNPSGLLKALGIGGAAPKRNPGQDAVYHYNGTKLTSSSNQIEVNGIKATLKAASVGEVITVSTASDPDAMYDFVKEFVTEYNKLIDEINLKIGTKPGKDIKPLTAEERKSMSEGEIKLWEDKLNSSLFYKDPELESFVNSARNMFGAKTDQAYNNISKKYDGAPLDFSYLSDLGIVTGPWQEGGKLHIMGDPDDELYSAQPNKLKAAIEANPQGVTDFLTTVGKKLYDSHNKTLLSNNKLKSAMKFYNDIAMTDKMKDFDKRIGTLEERMYKLEAMHYAKFARMETLLSSLNNQSSWLSQQFGG